MSKRTIFKSLRFENCTHVEFATFQAAYGLGKAAIRHIM